MSIKFAWKVESLEVVPVSGDLKDVVTRCAWSCTAEENRKIFSVGSNKYLGAPGTPFVEFANLTEDEVLEWVWANGINKAAAEQAAADGLKELSVVKPVPWKKPVDVAPYEAADRPWL
jgi:hypothetical protein